MHFEEPKGCIFYYGSPPNGSACTKPVKYLLKHTRGNARTCETHLAELTRYYEGFGPLGKEVL